MVLLSGLQARNSRASISCPSLLLMISLGLVVTLWRKEAEARG